MNAPSIPQTTTDGPTVAPEVTVTASTAPTPTAAAGGTPPTPPGLPQSGWITFLLPVTKRSARRMVNPKGEHFRRAQFITGGDQSKLGFAIAMVTCAVEDAPGSGNFAALALEDIDALPMADAVTLQREASTPLGAAAS